jgi:hypothetical protein
MRPQAAQLECSLQKRRTILLASLTSAGDVPAGVHARTLAEWAAVFGCASRDRQILFERIARIHRIVSDNSYLVRFMVFDDAFDASKCDHDRMMPLDQAMADACIYLSVFWLRWPAAFGGEQAAIEFRQTKRGGTRRGVVEIVSPKNDRT